MIKKTTREVRLAHMQDVRRMDYHRAVASQPQVVREYEDRLKKHPKPSSRPNDGDPED